MLTFVQPNPNATLPFPYVASLFDPIFPTSNATNTTAPNADGWGLRIVSSSNILIYGAGHYSFFDNYNVTCSNQGNGEVCQSRIVSIENVPASGANVGIYNLNTVGTHYMVTRDGVDVVYYADNLDGFVDTVAVWRSG